MRIGLASIHPRPLSGQIEQLVGLALALERAGHTVTVVSPFPSDRLLSPERSQLTAPSRRILVGQPARIVRVLTRLARLAPQVDVLQLNLPTPAFAMFADLLQIRVPVPVVVGYEAHLVRARDLMQHGYLWQAPAFYGPRLVINNPLVARMTGHRAAGYVVNSEYQKSELIALGAKPGRVAVLPPMLPCDKRDPPQAARETDLPRGRLLTFIGHYHHVKGVEVLVRAFRTLAPRYPDLSLVLAWSGVGSRRSIDRLLGDASLRGRVHQLGQVSVPELLGASAVMALPYRLTVGQAAFPSMLAEGFAAGVPVVTTDLPLLREFTDGGKTALLAPPDDPVALAGAIECVLTQPPLVQQMRQAQRQWVAQNAPERVVKEYERLYRQVVAR